MPPQKRWHVRTSSFLSSQVVSNQVLSTYECLTTVFGMGTGGTTQLSPLDFFVEVAVNVSQSRCAFSLRSWDVFAYELFPNRLHPCGFVSSTAQQRSTSANHAARFALAFLGRFRIRPVTQSASPLGQVSIPSKLYRRLMEHFRVTKHTRISRFFLP